MSLETITRRDHGWYQGRSVHVHYMIRTNPTSEVGHEFTSQLYFDESVTDQVHAQNAIRTKGPARHVQRGTGKVAQAGPKKTAARSTKKSLDR